MIAIDRIDRRLPTTPISPIDIFRINPPHHATQTRQPNPKQSTRNKPTNADTAYPGFQSRSIHWLLLLRSLKYFPYRNDLFELYLTTQTLNVPDPFSEHVHKTKLSIGLQEE
jgi:hypothetical protein